MSQEPRSGSGQGPTPGEDSAPGDRGRLLSLEAPGEAAELQLAGPSTKNRCLYVGTAGWSIPSSVEDEFIGGETHLQRYASRFTACEINTSFHRPHRPSTYRRWAASVPPNFLFSVKVPKAITHQARLQDTDELIDRFLSECRNLGRTLGCLLVQLPPSLAFEQAASVGFFGALRERYLGTVVCEPRHATWLHPDADALMREYHVARVAADPDQPAGAGEPGGWEAVRYYRLHGSPRTYYSSYPDEFLSELAGKLSHAVDEEREVWCIFDNTAAGAATRNAVDLSDMLRTEASP